MIKLSIDPIAFSLGPVHIRWYGLMYIVGYLIGAYLLRRMAIKGLYRIPKEKVDNVINYLVIGMIVGARVIYMTVYDTQTFFSNPLTLFEIWKGGLSYHGAIIGMLIAVIFYAKRNKINPLHVADLVALCGAQGVFFGRMGNFMNGELYGRPSDLPWAMIFPSGGPLPRHPSQLYEAILEGLLTFTILWLLKDKLLKKDGLLFSLYIILYGLFRFIVEFFREADSQMGYYLGGVITMGQILCFTMMIVGLVLFLYFKKKPLMNATR